MKSQRSIKQIQLHIFLFLYTYALLANQNYWSIMSFFKKIVALICGEKEELYTGPCYFDILFTKNVPHVLEQILFSLDYGSFKRCLRVNKAWNKLLNSESFQKKSRHIFQKEINLECERRLWKASKDGQIEEVRSLLLNKMLDVNHEEEEWWSDHDDSYDSWYFKDPYGPLSMATKYGQWSRRSG